MTDTVNNTPLQVLVSGTPEKNVAYVRVPTAQLGEVTQVLERHNIPFWVNETYVIWEGVPPMRTIYFRSWVNPQEAQAALDSVP